VDQPPRRQHSSVWSAPPLVKQAADLPATYVLTRARARNEFILKTNSSAAGVEEQEGLRAEHLLLGGAADVRVAEVVPLVGARFGVEVAVAHIGGVVPA
jgi:hypothetical protein